MCGLSLQQKLPQAQGFARWPCHLHFWVVYSPTLFYSYGNNHPGILESLRSPRGFCIGDFFGECLGSGISGLSLQQRLPQAQGFASWFPPGNPGLDNGRKRTMKMASRTGSAVSAIQLSLMTFEAFSWQDPQPGNGNSRLRHEVGTWCKHTVSTKLVKFRLSHGGTDKICFIWQ
jgi:hypothetical protein